MDKQFLEILVDRFRGFPQQLVIVKNVDGFLALAEVKSWFELNEMKVIDGSNIAFRLFFEMEIRLGRCRDEKVLFLNNRPDAILEDIRRQSSYDEFRLESYLPEYHLETLLGCHLDLLDFLYRRKPLHRLNKRETLKYILEHYYGIDADNFSSPEIVLAKWLDFYQKDLPADTQLVAYFKALSAEQVPHSAIESKPALLRYIQREWKQCALGKPTEIDFRQPQLQNILAGYFFRGALAPLTEDPSGNCQEIGIPYAVNVSASKLPTAAPVGMVESLVSSADSLDWEQAAATLGQSIAIALAADDFLALRPAIDKLNRRFQQHLDTTYRQQILPSNAYKRPRVVSKVLPHLKSKHAPEDKTALLVVDGMAFWQYCLLKEPLGTLGADIEEHLMYAWIPSVTYLSRQAIFRGSTPESSYTQSPANEEKLWKAYWHREGMPASMVRYDYQQVEPQGLPNLRRLAVVYSELDEKMHSSSDYQDLYDLTINWIARSNIEGQVAQLLGNGFTVYLTTDHGNLEATAWRSLKGQEKFGSSRSRSKRHLEYAETWLSNAFLANNPELASSIGKDDRTLYLRDNRSFSNRELEVTHGGSHILEVLIPFIKLSK